ncbi:MAG TPA: hypothetical protein VE954_06910, partial [Oligoflexus sp.]|uniref:hypothetical protein n=1 Tax=Oligoflexus sp. TaxID=1971216 RepID=UPI002D3CBBDD
TSVLIDNQFGLGILLGTVVAFLLSSFGYKWLYKRNKRDSLIIQKGTVAIKSYNDIQERNMCFYQENEKELLGLLRIAVEDLEEADSRVEAEALTRAVDDWITERNIEGVAMNAEFLLHAEKVVAFKDLIFEDAKEENADQFKVSGEIRDQPLLRLVKDSSDELKD